MNRSARALLVESRKLVDTRAQTALIVSALLLCLGIAVLESVLAPEPSVGRVLPTAAAPLYLAVPIAAILSITSEWTRRGALITFAAEPSRPRVAAAKLGASLLLTVGLVLAVSLMAGAAAATALAVRGAASPLAAASGADAVVTVLITASLSVLTAAAVAFLIPSTAAAIVVFIVFTLAVDGVVGALGPVGSWLSYNRAVEGLSTGAVGSVPQTAVALVVWLLVPLVVGVVVFSRREVR
jgi:ABC-2 type transport system permease protein